MNLLEQYGLGDQAGVPDGDAYFVGVDERRAPVQLSPGVGAYAKNKRFRDGEAATRLGYVTLGWMKGAGLTPFSAVYGAAVFHDPNQGVDWILIAADGGVWKTRPNSVATAVPLPAGVTLTAATFANFVQARGALLLLRGDDATVLECRDLDTGFIEVVVDPDAGTDPIPNTSDAVYFGNRVFAVKGRDNVAVSDLLDYTAYQAVTNTFKINEGDSDALLAIRPWNADTLVMFKERSVWRVVNVRGDLGDAQGPLAMTRQYGLQSRKSLVESGTDLYWQSELGIVNLRLTELNQEQATTQILSLPMQETSKRLNGNYAAKGRLALHDGKLFWAFPADEGHLLGPELVPAAAVYDVDGEYGLDLEAAATFVWKDDPAQDGQTVLNDVTELDEPGSFVAAAASITLLHGTAGDTVRASIRQVLAAGVNNVIAVYDTQLGAWQGVDEGRGVAVVDFLSLTVNGAPRLLFMGADGWLRLCEEGYEDSIPQRVEGVWEIVPAAIEDEFLTRGYPCQDGRGKRYAALNMLLGTWAPKYSLGTRVNGANETYVTDSERVAGGAMVHGAADWDATNDGDDHDAARREDYSVVLAAGVPMGLRSGVNFDLHQENSHAVVIDEKGKWLQVRVRNTEGRCVVKAAMLEAVVEGTASGIT